MASLTRIAAFVAIIIVFSNTALAGDFEQRRAATGMLRQGVEHFRGEAGRFGAPGAFRPDGRPWGDDRFRRGFAIREEMQARAFERFGCDLDKWYDRRCELDGGVPVVDAFGQVVCSTPGGVPYAGVAPYPGAPVIPEPVPFIAGPVPVEPPVPVIVPFPEQIVDLRKVYFDPYHR